ncbi:nuclear transport factor 2 family protein [Rhizobiales bacterium RZME27]|uniref:Nuclear transport factor 2 family protein n=1 Tax=Endobacterium cereale TaxID=2663029 RepID=A0A6A8A0Y7_9HYPH|nr:nuclear transport factor 2 family protein [Endobacterium cereale]MQY44465.1 nuclear transport factor 2 family protein [Endobacterium cereale]
MNMPLVVESYFEADNRNDAGAFSAAFSIGAIVEDDGARHLGSTAILDWWAKTRKTARYVVEPLEAKVNGEKAFVRAKVSGEFSGSPVMLDYCFTFRGGKIIRLEIV